MNRSIIIGNGINIQFGGLENTNKQIIERAIKNMATNNFPDVAYPKETESLLEILYATIPDILKGKYDNYAMFDHEKSELKNFKLRTTKNAKKSDIGFEDYFLINDLLSRKANLTEEEVIYGRKSLKRLFLDAIYNGGKVNEIHLSFTEKFTEFLNSFDQVFTTNYDRNLERAAKKEICYLHGGFHVLDGVYDPNSLQNILPEKAFDGLTDLTGYEYLFSTAIAASTGAHKKHEAERSRFANSALEKYVILQKSDPEMKEKIESFRNSDDIRFRRLYEAIVLKTVKPEIQFPDEYAMDKLIITEGTMVFVGLSPNNDSHIMNAVRDNPSIDTIKFYYYDQSELNTIRSFFSNKNLETLDVKDLWSGLR